MEYDESVLYYDPEQEKKDFDDALLELCRKEGMSEGLTLGRAEQQRDIIINMYKANEVVEKISKYTELPIKKIKQVINDYLKNNK